MACAHHGGGIIIASHQWTNLGEKVVQTAGTAKGALSPDLHLCVQVPLLLPVPAMFCPKGGPAVSLFNGNMPHFVFLQLCKILRE